MWALKRFDEENAAAQVLAAQFRLAEGFVPFHAIGDIITHYDTIPANDYALERL